MGGAARLTLGNGRGRLLFTWIVLLGAAVAVCLPMMARR